MSESKPSIVSAVFTGTEAAEKALSELRTSGFGFAELHLVSRSGDGKLTRQKGPSTSISADSGQKPIPRESTTPAHPGLTSEMIGAHDPAMPDTARSSDLGEGGLADFGFDRQTAEKLRSSIDEGDALVLVKAGNNRVVAKKVLERNGGRIHD